MKENLVKLLAFVIMGYLVYDTLFSAAPMEVKKNSPIVEIAARENEPYRIPIAVWVVVVVGISGYVARVIYQSRSKRAATNALYDAVKEESGKIQNAKLVRDEFGTDPVITKNNKTFTMGNTDNLQDIDPDSTEEYRNNKPK